MPVHAVIDAILTRIRQARAIQIVGHVRPDGDCIGSMLAMHGLLEQWGIPHAMAAAQMGVNGYDRMEGFDRIRPDVDPAFDHDLTIYVDCANIERGPADWSPRTPIINIDHHSSNTRFGDLQWIDPKASSVGEMIYALVRRADVRLTPAMATAMLVAITTDTGSFRFGNTGALQHRIAADLIEAGACPTEVATMAWGSQAPEAVKLMGKVLGDMRLEADGRLAWSEIRLATYLECGGDRGAPENLGDSLRQVRGVVLSLLFHELAGGGIRVNFRSTGAVDVSGLAAVWGGGGHAAAAGLTIAEGDYETLRNEVLERARAAVTAL